MDISSSAVFSGNTAGWAGPNIYAAASWTDVPVEPSADVFGLQQVRVSGPVVEVLVAGEGLEDYVCSDDVYLQLKVHVLDAWKQPVSGKTAAELCVEEQPLQCGALFNLHSLGISFLHAFLLGLIDCQPCLRTCLPACCFLDLLDCSFNCK
jgi:hypothetical protein